MSYEVTVLRCMVLHRGIMVIIWSSNWIQRKNNVQCFQYWNHTAKIMFSEVIQKQIIIYITLFHSYTCMQYGCISLTRMESMLWYLWCFVFMLSLFFIYLFYNLTCVHTCKHYHTDWNNRVNSKWTMPKLCVLTYQYRLWTVRDNKWFCWHYFLSVIWFK